MGKPYSKMSKEEKLWDDRLSGLLIFAALVAPFILVWSHA
jgi:hypothetical protein